MGKLIFSLNISLDGCYDHTLFNPDEELMEYFADLMQGFDLIVYGRKMYELMFPYWSDVAKTQAGTKAENRFAQTITEMDKIVFSRSLESVEGNTRILRENLEDEMSKLKLEPGKKISIDSITLFSQLMALGLIDGINLVVHPAIVGEGKRLWEGIIVPGGLNLKLADSRIFKSGCTALHYLKQQVG